jgi:hypothetical protein
MTGIEHRFLQGVNDDKSGIGITFGSVCDLHD